MTYSVRMTLPNIALPLVLMWTSIGQAAAYRITRLDTAGGSRTSEGFGINSLGHVAGDFSNGYFIYNGSFNAHTVGGTFPRAINEAGKVVGNSGPNAFLWTPDAPNGGVGKLKNIGTLGGSTATAWDINDNGYVTGGSTLEIGKPGEHAFIYDGVTMRDLGTLGGANSTGRGINNSGWVTGESNRAGSSTRHAFLYDGTTMRDLGTLGGESFGIAINAHGHVAGRHTQLTTRTFLYDGVTMRDIGSLGGPGDFIFTFPYGMNDLDQIVGMDTSTGEKAFLYTPGIGIVDLNTLIDPASGWQLTSANAINNFGQITGKGLFNGVSQAYLLTPVLSADFYSDGEVDSQDFSNWKIGYGLSNLATHTLGDADGDMDVDGQDFLTWQREFGARTTAGASPVPEPSYLALCCLPSGVLAVCRARRR